MPWFEAALKTRSGAEYVALDVDRSAPLHGAQVATYATAVRARGDANGEVLGALGIFFDWQPQASAVFARTPGYETYTGLGWYGVIEQQP